MFIKKHRFFALLNNNTEVQIKKREVHCIKNELFPFLKKQKGWNLTTEKFIVYYKTKEVQF